jgi:hypothetical protein
MANRAENKSLSDMEREAEHTRANLIHTVDELHSRVSPQAIKEEVKAYARDTGNELIHSLQISRAPNGRDRRHREFCGRFNALATDERERPSSVCRRARIDFLQHHSRTFRRAVLTAGSNLHQPHCDHALRFKAELRRVDP